MPRIESAQPKMRYRIVNKTTGTELEITSDPLSVLLEVASYAQQHIGNEIEIYRRNYIHLRSGIGPKWLLVISGTPEKSA